MDEKLRLNRYLALCGICSRREADKLIEENKVKVNGKIVEDFSLKVNDKDKIEVCGKKISTEKFVYIRYNKPAGYITSASDEKGRKTIYDILPEEVKNLKPAGRLDKDSSGLLIMTNDGDLINKLTHPKVKIPKVYRVCLKGKVKHADLVLWSEGIEIEPGKKAFAESRLVEYEDNNSVLEVILYQGLNRQIRKMADFINHPVISLKRIKHATINLDGVKKGAFKYITPQQLKELKNYLKSREKEL